MNISTYLDVEDLNGSAEFFCDAIQLFTLQHNDVENCEMVLSHRLVPGFKLVLRTSVVTSHNSLFHLSMQVRDCKSLFNKISDLEPEKLEWRVSKEFFGTYLSSPVGDQFAIRNNLNVGILFYSDNNFN